MRRPAALLLALATLPVLVGGAVVAATPASAGATCSGTGATFAGGSGITSDPYQVATAAQLNSIRGDYLRCDFVQTADISLAAHSPWMPLGTTEGRPGYFTGSYDGRGFAITGMNAQATGPDPTAGLFNFLDGATVSNLRISGSATGRAVVGGLAGRAHGGTVVTNVHVNATIVADTSQAGGLIGDSSATIRRSSARGSVSGYNGIGGLVGTSAFGTYEDVMSSALVSGTVDVGGLIGVQFVGGTNTTYNRAYAHGPVTGTMGTGGLLERFDNPFSMTPNVTDAWWDPATTGQSFSAIGTSRSTADLRNANAFGSGWAMATAWTAGATGWAICARADSGYPFL
jgi:hypothetical protein